MILVDTSIWIDHLHQSDARLVARLDRALVVAHPMVIGELALGRIAQRAEVLSALGGLPTLPVPSIGEVLAMIEVRDLQGRGLGLVDAYLLASALLVPGTLLWTRDKRLAATAALLRVRYDAD